MESRLPVQRELNDLTDVVCWTRMQAESGQDVRAIVSRKELERRAGNGLFFWGIGNAPNRTVRDRAIRGEKIDVVFSLMKSRPKSRDIDPTGVIVWQTYFDTNGIENSLPENVLITSRMDTTGGMKRVHYALMCSSDEELRIEDQGPFDPLAYRNVSEIGGRIGASQVTALVVKTASESSLSNYRVNLRAELTGSYWVRLGEPCVITGSAFEALATSMSNVGEIRETEWIDTVSHIRNCASANLKSRLSLF